MRKRLTYANVVATLALIIAVAGVPTAIAVTVQSSKNSDVDKKGNIRAGHVTADTLANIEVVSAGRSTSGEASAQCFPGERMLSGGYASGQPVGINRPDNNGWTATFISSGGGVVFAVCLKP
jgi:hypothetical protein